MFGKWSRCLLYYFLTLRLTTFRWRIYFKPDRIWNIRSQKASGLRDETVQAIPKSPKHAHVARAVPDGMFNPGLLKSLVWAISFLASSLTNFASRCLKQGSATCSVTLLPRTWRYMLSLDVASTNRDAWKEMPMGYTWYLFFPARCFFLHAEEVCQVTHQWRICNASSDRPKSLMATCIYNYQPDEHPYKPLPWCCDPKFRQRIARW